MLYTFTCTYMYNTVIAHSISIDNNIVTLRVSEQDIIPGVFENVSEFETRHR